MIDQNELKTLQGALETLAEGFSNLPDFAHDFDWGPIEVVSEILQHERPDNRGNKPCEVAEGRAQRTGTQAVDGVVGPVVPGAAHAIHHELDQERDQEERYSQRDEIHRR